MRVVVDYVSFSGSSEPIIKEVAVCSVGSKKRFHHFVFQPPKAWSSLSAEERQHYYAQTKTVHGLGYDSGTIPYRELSSTLKDSLKRVTAIYAFGEEKTQRLATLLDRAVINLEKEFNAPPPHHMALEGLTCLAPCHAVPSLSCALKQASILAQWLHYYILALQIKNFCPQNSTVMNVEQLSLCNDNF